VTLLERERLFPEGHPYHRSPSGQLAVIDDATSTTHAIFTRLSL
jgi:hypothetical protein